MVAPNRQRRPRPAVLAKRPSPARPVAVGWQFVGDRRCRASPPLSAAQHGLTRRPPCPGRQPVGSAATGLGARRLPSQIDGHRPQPMAHASSESPEPVPALAKRPRQSPLEGFDRQARPQGSAARCAPGEISNPASDGLCRFVADLFWSASNAREARTCLLPGLDGGLGLGFYQSTSHQTSERRLHQKSALPIQPGNNKKGRCRGPFPCAWRRPAMAGPRHKRGQDL